MADVFISYRRDTGSTMAMLLKLELERNGFDDCFLDVASLSLGHFDDALLDEIERALFFCAGPLPRMSRQMQRIW